MSVMKKRSYRQISPLSSAIMLACLMGGSAFAQQASSVKLASDAVANSPFAYLSLNLQTATVPSSGGKAPTNILLFIDDSGSMQEFVRNPNAQCKPGWVKIRAPSYNVFQFNSEYFIYAPDICYDPNALKCGAQYGGDRLDTQITYVVAERYDAAYNSRYGLKGKVEAGNKFRLTKVDSPRSFYESGVEGKSVMERGFFTPFCFDQRSNQEKYFKPDDLGKTIEYIDMTRIETVKTALLSEGTGDAEGILTRYQRREEQDPTKRGEILWSVRTLWGNESLKGDMYKKIMPVGLYPPSSGYKVGRGGVSYPFTSNYQTVREIVGRIKGFSTTPATSQYLFAAEHMIDNIEYVCQQNYIVMLSDGDPNTENNAWYRGGTYDIANGSYGIPVPNRDFYGSVPWTYQFNGTGRDHGISFFSRKLAQGDVKKQSSSPRPDKDGLGWDNPLFPNQTIRTYTVGFKSGLSANGKKYLDEAGEANGTGAYFADSLVELQDAFKKIFDSIDKGIANAEVAAKETHAPSAPAITPSVSTNYKSLGINLTLDTGKWASTLEFTELNSDGTVNADAKKEEAQGARSKRYAHFPAARQVIVNTGERNYLLTPNMNFDSPEGIEIRKAFKFSDTQANEFKRYFIPWYLRDQKMSDSTIQTGAKTIAEASRRVQSYRVRAAQANDVVRMMGDVMDAPLLAMERDEERRERRKSGLGSYQKYLITAANDGMVYIFKAQQSGSSPYSLALNYLPAGMERESATDTLGNAVVATAEEKYGNTITSDQVTLPKQPHLYLNNGGLQWRETAPDANEKTALYLGGAVGQGGRGAYLLAIGGHERGTSTNIGLDAGSTSWLTSVPLWETEKGSNNTLGYTLSTPQFAQTATQYSAPDPAQPNVKKADFKTGVRQLLFLANGYDAPASNAVDRKFGQKPSLHIYDALGQEMGKDTTAGITSGSAKGSKIKMIEMPDGMGGLSTPVLVDTDGDYMADHAYAGDRGGNVYRIILKGTPDEWKAVKIYKGNQETVSVVGANGVATSKELPTQPISAKPAVYKVSPTKYIVLVGTGSDIYQSDLTDKSRQVFLGLFDDLSNDAPTAVAQSDLVKQNITELKTANGKNYRYVSKQPVNDINTGGKGWYLELGPQDTPDGERVVAAASVLNGAVFFTSRVYKTSQEAPEAKGFSCKVSETKIESSGTSWIYALNVKTGQASTSSTATLSAFVPDNKGAQGNNPNNAKANEGAAGLQLLGISSAVVISSITEMTQEGIVATDASGGFKDGSDQLASETGSDKRSNKCVNYNDINASLVDESGLNTFGISAEVCPGRMIRVNSRQIRDRLF